MMTIWRFFCLLLFNIYYVQSNPLNLNSDNITDYRLPKSVLPENYNLKLTLHEDIFSFHQYAGNVNITVTVKEDKVNAIKLHANNYLSIITTKLQDSAANEIPLITSDYNSETEILTLNYEKLIKDASYALYIEFVGRLSTNDMLGIYQSSYLDGPQEEYLVSTQFEPVYARRCFPCFDEPGFKATFEIEVECPTTMQFISNTPQSNLTTDNVTNSQTITFEKTPKMSTYLVAFLLSNFTSTTNKEKDFSLYSRPGTENNRRTALTDGPQILSSLGDYFGSKYYDLGINKMDIVALPDFAPGAMENWGLVTFKENDLLDDDSETSKVMKQQISSVIAHEFAHQWFGDYITLDWWSDVWLNEGFATFFGMEIINQLHEDYEMEKQFATGILQSAFEADALHTSPPLSSNATDINKPAEILSKLDTISYDKGASILRMMKYFLSEPIFKDGLKNYLSTNKYGNVDVAAFLASYPADKYNLTYKLDEIMKNWTENSGYPVVTVSYTNGKLTLTQARYLSDGASSSSSLWHIPITYTLSSDKTQFTNTTTKLWLTEKKQTFDLTLNKDDWIILNNQRVGYYRVTYSADLLKRIIAVLTKDPSQIDVLSRVHLVDDTFNAAKINLINYQYAFDLSDYLAKENNYHVWTSAFKSYDFLLKQTGISTPLGKAIAAKLTASMAALLEAVPIDADFSKNHIESLNQALTHQWACNLGNATTIKKTKELFKAYKNSATKITPDLRKTVYCCAIRNADKPQKDEKSDWDFLWGAYSTASPAEKNVILSALGCTKDTKILQRYLEKSIDVNSGIRKQDASNVFHAVYSNNPEGVDVALNFLKNNFQNITEYYKGFQSVSSIIAGLAESVTTKQQIDTLKEILKENGVNDEVKNASEQAIETATQNLQWFNKFEGELDIVFNIHPNHPDNNGAGSVQFGITFIITTMLTLYTLL